ncbi:MAG: ACT domain-containing protein [Nitrospiraceae bacterium]|nr:MAG: ACT domain-containing protein [Nitrospiraceae bacterium]
MAKAAQKTTPKKARSTAAKSAPKKTGTPEYTAKTAKEITVTFVDSVGLTAKVAAALAAANVNILAGTGYSASEMRRMATFTFIVDDLVKAEKALYKLGAEEIQDSSVIVAEMANRVGALKRISKIIADAGINIYYFYSTTSSGKTATCVIKTADDQKTLKLLREAR